MDKAKAIELERHLKGETFEGYNIVGLVNNGKSAAVFKAERSGVFFALKIFDNELIEKFGHEIQTKRIEQEIALNNHGIANLVSIFEGGHTNLNGQPYYFIIMEFIDGCNLKDYILTKEYDQGFILNVFDKLIKTTETLLNQKHIAHRDIKPENIMVRENGEIILMDLGVLKLVGAKSFTDEEERSFVGTLRYAAPEFLLREEQDSTDGWRALNYYQIGATLHDLIMKNELFINSIPYTNLVVSIMNDNPKLSSISCSYELLQCVRDMLSKNWLKRLELISNERINKILLIGSNVPTSYDNEIDELLKLRMPHLAKFDEIENLRISKAEARVKQKAIATNLITEIDKCLLYLQEKNVFTSLEKSKGFLFPNEDTSQYNIQNYLYRVKGELKYGFPRDLFLLIRTANNEVHYAEIEILGIFTESSIASKFNDPGKFFSELAQRKIRSSLNRAPITFNTYTLFKGTLELDDSFQADLKVKVTRLIMKGLKSVEDEVRSELEWRATIEKSNQKTFSRTISSPIIYIDTL